MKARLTQLVGGHRRALAIGVVAAVGYSVAASFTQPFTIRADSITAVPIAIAATGVTLRLRSWRRHSVCPALDRDADGGYGLGRWKLMWAAVAAAALSWELFCFVSAPRSAHPTLSELINLADASRPGKTVVFALWLGLGSYLVLR